MLASHRNSADVELGIGVRTMEERLKKDNGPPGNPFDGKDFTTAEVLRDVKTILVDQPDLPLGSDFKKKLADKNDIGLPHELRTGAHVKQKLGHKLEGIPADDGETLPDGSKGTITLPDGTKKEVASKADWITDRAHIQCGVNLVPTISAKMLEKSTQFAEAIKLARERGKHFIFAFSGNGSVPIPQNALEELNKSLAKAYGYDDVSKVPLDLRFPSRDAYPLEIPIE